MPSGGGRSRRNRQHGDQEEGALSGSGSVPLAVPGPQQEGAPGVRGRTLAEQGFAADANSLRSCLAAAVGAADDEGGGVIGINQVVWDPETHTLHAESDALLDQHTRYALIVTRGVRDQFDQPVGATEAFRQFRQHVSGEYQLALLDAMAPRAASGCPNATL